MKVNISHRSRALPLRLPHRLMPMLLRPRALFQRPVARRYRRLGRHRDRQDARRKWLIRDCSRYTMGSGGWGIEIVCYGGLSRRSVSSCTCLPTGNSLTGQQDFSHVRKTAETFLGRSRRTQPTKPSGQGHRTPGPSAGLPLSSRKATTSSRPDPIILLSPSASSLIRMSNVKSFLQDGIFVPTDHPTLAMSTSSNLLSISRPLGNAAEPSAMSARGGTGTVAGKKPTRFILVDSTANFRPDYWQRLVAVFTTGQTWQFKSYKWTSPPELFKHATGIYVGWRGEEVPREVKSWGRGVQSFAVERWDEKGGGTNGAGRWRDREVVEGIWMAIEEGMRLRGWSGR